MIVSKRQQKANQIKANAIPMSSWSYSVPRLVLHVYIFKFGLYSQISFTIQYCPCTSTTTTTTILDTLYKIEIFWLHLFFLNLNHVEEIFIFPQLGGGWVMRPCFTWISTFRVNTVTGQTQSTVNDGHLCLTSSSIEIVIFRNNKLWNIPF